MTRSRHVLLMAVATLFAGSLSSHAQQKEVDATSEAKMMEEYAKLGAPGEEHMLLEKLSGSWEITSNMFMAPAQEPLVATGNSENKMILGGRFLECYASAAGGGIEADALNIIGYDKRNGIFIMVAFDTFGTYFVTAKGKFDSATKKLVLSGEDFDPVAGFNQVFDYVYDFSDESKIVMEVIFKNPELTHGQDEYRMVEVIYTKSSK